jgi:hypothetical protein
MEREAELKRQVVSGMPEFAKSCESDVSVVLIHQDAYAADYQMNEYALLGMAIKYAGLFGKEVRVNRNQSRDCQG